MDRLQLKSRLIARKAVDEQKVEELREEEDKGRRLVRTLFYDGRISAFEDVIELLDESEVGDV